MPEENIQSSFRCISSFSPVNGKVLIKASSEKFIIKLGITYNGSICNESNVINGNSYPHINLLIALKANATNSTDYTEQDTIAMISKFGVLNLQRVKLKEIVLDATENNFEWDKLTVEIYEQ